MFSVNPIAFTANVAEWERILLALGMVRVEDSPGWKVYRSAFGMISLHDSPVSEVREEAWFETADPQASAEQFAHPNFSVVVRNQGDGNPAEWAVYSDSAAESEVVTGYVELQQRELPAQQPEAQQPDGQQPDGQQPDGQLLVQALLYTPDVSDIAGRFERIGLQPQVKSDRGAWFGFSSEDGLVGVHIGERIAARIGFEYTGDIEALQQRLAAAGVEAKLIDEAYANTLRIAHPDGGEEIWVMETQTDYYGYTKLD